MKKRRKSRSTLNGTRRKTSAKSSTLADTAMQVGCILGGLVVGSQVKNLVAKKDAVSGTDLLGFDGETSKFVTPSLILAAGAALTALSKGNKHVKNIALGVTIAGGAGLVNAISGKPVVALGAADDGSDYSPVVLPGVGRAGTADTPVLPGVGNAPITDFSQLPTNHDYSMNPHLVYADTQNVGDVEEYDDVAGIGSSSLL